MHVIATAGHVDHGKSSLILALTGIDPDRWNEEKERGLTIDLGFAHVKLPSGQTLSLVDVPGHIRFIKNMLAGVGAVDGVIFVVAATEGWKPQSEEHLRILDLLGIKSGIIALTKSSLVDEEWLELAKLEVSDNVKGTFLENSPIVAVDSITRLGWEELISEIEHLLSSTPTSPDLNRPRLWIDRVFSAKGSGTVITGTLTGGTIRLDDEMTIFHSAGKSWNVKASNVAKQFVTIINTGSKVRVRSLESHGQKLVEATPGRRLALNLNGVAPENVTRGDVLIKGEQWCATTVFDGSIKVLSNLSHKLSKKGAYAIYLGSGDFPVKLQVLGKNALEPGESGKIRVHLPSLVPLCRGDHFIVRELGRQETVGGGEVLDINPIQPATSANPTGEVSQLVEERGVVDAPLIYRMTGESVTPNLADRYVISDRLRETIQQELLEKVDNAQQIGFEISNLDDISRAVLATLPELTVDSSKVYRSGRGDLKDALALHPYIQLLEASLFSPPSPENVDRQQLRELVKRGLVIEFDSIYFSPKAVEKAKETIWEMCNENPTGFTVSALREKLGTSRKYLLPLVGYLDSNGFTRRNGDLRTPGPALVRELSAM